MPAFSAGSASWNPHWHTIVLEGGFDRQDIFFFIPIGAGAELCEAWRRTVVALFLDKGLLNLEFARTLLSWRHSGFSIDSGTRSYDTQARQGLCQYILRAPLAMQKLEWDGQQDTVPWAGNCTVTWHSSPTGYFQGKQVHFSCPRPAAVCIANSERPGLHRPGDPAHL